MGSGRVPIFGRELHEDTQDYALGNFPLPLAGLVRPLILPSSGSHGLDALYQGTTLVGP